MKKRIRMGRVSKMRKVYTCPRCGGTVTLVIRRTGHHKQMWPPEFPPIGGQCKRCLVVPYLPGDPEEN